MRDTTSTASTKNYRSEFLRTINGVKLIANSVTMGEIVAHLPNGKSSMFMITFTPEAADKILTGLNYSRQRGAKRRQLKYIEDQMRKGKFLPYSMISFKYEDGEFTLLDGQHRLLSCSECGVPFTGWVQIIDTSDESKEIYAVTDTGSARTTFDGLHALGVELDDLSSKQKRDLIAAVQKIYTAMSSVTRDRITAESLLEMVRPWLDTGKLYFDCIQGGPNAYLLKASRLMSVGILTFRYQPEIATSFWKGLSYDDGLTANDPRKVLLRHLNDNNSFLRSPLSVHDRKAALLVSKSWNHFYNNVEVNRMIIDTAAPVVIDGTPYNTGLPGCGLE